MLFRNRNILSDLISVRGGVQKGLQIDIQKIHKALEFDFI